jgi:signal transduction histidine kinase
VTPRSPSKPRGEGGLNQEIADLLEQGVIVLDDTLSIVSWNRWMADAAQLDAHQAVGRSLFDVFPEIKDTDRAVALERALHGEVVVYSHRFHEYFLPLVTPAGFTEMSRMQQSARIAPRVKDGKTIGVIILIQDVTERTVRESELRQALEHAQIANRAKADFLSSMSHELRTPLNVILGYSQLMSDGIGGTLNPDQGRKVDRIKQAVWHLLSIIDEILTFSRVEAGKEVMKAEPVDLVDLINDAIVMLQNEAAAKELALAAHTPVEHLPITTDARRLRQILLNLLGNALKFTQRGGVNLVLEVERERAVIHVTDTGRGIDSSRLEDIFEPFTRVDAGEGPSGTGLGLPLSRRLARLLGGDISVRSTRDQGSTFTLVLPLDSDSA